MDLSAASSRALRRVGDGSIAKILNAYQVLQTKESARCSCALLFYRLLREIGKWWGRASCIMMRKRMLTSNIVLTDYLAACACIVTSKDACEIVGN